MTAPLFLVDPESGSVLYGADGEKVQKAKSSDVTVKGGFVTDAKGYTVLTPKEINTSYKTISALTLSVDENTAIKVQGVRNAFQGTKTMVYDEKTDSITNTTTNTTYTVQKVGKSEYFVDSHGNKLAQSWKQNVGLANFQELFSNTSLVKQLAGAPGGDSYAEALRELFELKPGAAEAVSAPDHLGGLPSGDAAGDLGDR